MNIVFDKPNAAFRAHEQSLLRPVARPAPRDTPTLWRRAREMFGVVMETELWPSLMRQAERLGVPLSGGCRVGQCETCRITLRAGQVWHRGDVPALEAYECLACLAVPVTDVEIDG